MSAQEFRVVWKREGLSVKRKRFARRASADKFLLLFGPEPWLYLGKGPDDLYRGGDTDTAETYREHDEQTRRELPKLEWIRVEARDVGAWAPA